METLIEYLLKESIDRDSINSLKTLSRTGLGVRQWRVPRRLQKRVQRRLAGQRWMSIWWLIGSRAMSLPKLMVPRTKQSPFGSIFLLYANTLQKIQRIQKHQKIQKNQNSLYQDRPASQANRQPGPRSGAYSCYAKTLQKNQRIKQNRKTQNSLYQDRPASQANRQSGLRSGASKWCPFGSIWPVYANNLKK